MYEYENKKYLQIAYRSIYSTVASVIETVVH